MVRYNITEEIDEGSDDRLHEKKENYDLMTVFILGLGRYPEESSSCVLQMLSTAFSCGLSVQDKKRMLEVNHGLRMTETIERTVEHMGGLGYGIYLEGREEGRTEGKIELLYELLSQDLLPIEVAVLQSGLTEEEFRRGWESYRASMV